MTKAQDEALIKRLNSVIDEYGFGAFGLQWQDLCHGYKDSGAAEEDWKAIGHAERTPQIAVMVGICETVKRASEKADTLSRRILALNYIAAIIGAVATIIAAIGLAWSIYTWNYEHTHSPLYELRPRNRQDVSYPYKALDPPNLQVPERPNQGGLPAANPTKVPTSQAKDPVLPTPHHPATKQ